MKRTVTKREARLPTKPPTPRQELIDAGCNGRILDSFVADWNGLKDASQRERQKDDLDRFKTEITNMAAGLERIAGDAERLGQRKRYDGYTWEESLVPYLVDDPGTAPPPDFFRAWTAEVRQQAALLKKLKAAIADDWSMQRPDELHLLMLLESYCRLATGGCSTIRQITELLNDDETAVRMRLTRFRQTYTPDSIRQREQSVMDYIAEVPDGDLTFFEWVLRKEAAILEERTTSERAPGFAAQSPWYRGK